MIRITITQEGKTPQLYTFDRFKITIGRNSDNDICLPIVGVSGRHCQIEMRNQELWIEDLGSTNGTYLNRQKVSKATRFSEADTVLIATCTVRIPSKTGSQPVVPSTTKQGLGAPQARSVQKPSQEQTQKGHVAPPVKAPAPVQRSGSIHDLPVVESTILPKPGPSVSVQEQAKVQVAKPVQPVSAPSASAQPASNTPLLQTKPTAKPAAEAKTPVYEPDVESKRIFAMVDPLARDWAETEDPNNLLYGRDLADAEKWVRRGNKQNPVPETLHRQFIAASRKATRKSWLTKTGLASLSLGAFLGGSGTGYLLIGFDLPEPPERAGPSSEISKECLDAQKQTKKVQELIKDRGSTNVNANVLYAVETLRLAYEHECPRNFELERTVHQALNSIRGYPLIGHGFSVKTVAIAPNGNLIATASDDQTIRLWQRTKHESPLVLGDDLGRTYALTISPDGRWLVAAGEDHLIRRWDLQAEDLEANRWTLKGHESEVTQIVFSSDSRWLLSGSDDKTARVWDMNATEPSNANVGQLKGHEGQVTAVAFNKTASTAFTASADRSVRIWKLNNGVASKSGVELRIHNTAIHALAMSDDQKWMITGGEDGAVYRWDLNKVSSRGYTPDLLTGPQGPKGAVRVAKIAPNSRWAVIGSDDNNLYVWDLELKNPIDAYDIWRGHGDDVTDIAISPDSTRVVSASKDTSIRVWDITRKDRTVDAIVLQGHERAVNALSISDDGFWLVSGSDDTSARVWDYRSRRPGANSTVARGHSDEVADIALVEDDNQDFWAITASKDKTARYWHINNEDYFEQVAVLSGHTDPLRSTAISSNGRWAATGGSSEATIALWDLSDPQAKPRMLATGGGSNKVGFSPDGKWLVSVNLDTTAYAWRLSDEGPLGDPIKLPHSGEVLTLAFLPQFSGANPNPNHPDSALLITAGVHQARGNANSRNPIHIWDLSVADVKSTQQSYEGILSQSIWAVAVSPKGQLIAAGGEDRMIQLWDPSRANPGEIQPLRGHENTIKALMFSPDDRWLVSAGNEKVIYAWDMRSEYREQDAKKFVISDGIITSIQFTPDSKTLLTAGSDGILRLWDLEGTETTTSAAIELIGHEDAIQTLTMGADGGFVVSASKDGTARLWPLAYKNMIGMGCRAVGRNMKEEEWNSFFEGIAWQETCPTNSDI